MLANIVTASRILFSIPLLFTVPFSPLFYALFLLAAATDVLDGFIARKTHTAGRAGAVLDTVSDAVFFTVCAWLLLPKLAIESWLWYWFAGIAFIKILTVTVGFCRRKRFPGVHSFANKAVGVLLFFFVLFCPLLPLTAVLSVLSATATFAALQEFVLVLRGKF